MTELKGIKLDYSRDELFTEQGDKLMRGFYMLPEEKSPQEALARAALAYCEGDIDFAQRIYDYASKQWFMFASPVLSNAPKFGGEIRGLPISCFLSYVPDDVRGIIEHKSEVAWLSVKGGGVGGHWSDIRGVSKKSPGAIPFLKTLDSDILAFHQGTTRRGSYAAYMDISHPDIWEFVAVRDPAKGGDINRQCPNLFPAVNVTDNFMEKLTYENEQDRQWNLIDPDDGTTRDTFDARKLWQRILKNRAKTGTPYINFIDTANAGLPETQRKLGLRINGSNLCNEIHLATDRERTAVCCLSSVNLAKYDEWKGTGMVRDIIRLLDNILEFFIRNAPSQLEKAVFSAKRERSVGLGAMGFHSYLQKNMIPWESGLHGASSINYDMFKYINEEAVEASKELARERGEAPDMEGTGMRNAHLIAIAPNANSSILCGTSASIEPIKSNAYTHRTRVGADLIVNEDLKELLIKHKKDTKKVWDSIIANDGSVQHLDFLSQLEKDVYKTAFEINQQWVVEHAAARQDFICQGQSLNLFFPSGIDPKYVNKVHRIAWEKGLKGLYYYRTNAGETADKTGVSIEREALVDFSADLEECLSCQG